MKHVPLSGVWLDWLPDSHHDWSSFLLPQVFRRRWSSPSRAGTRFMSLGSPQLASPPACCLLARRALRNLFSDPRARCYLFSSVLHADGEVGPSHRLCTRSPQVYDSPELIALSAESLNEWRAIEGTSGSLLQATGALWERRARNLCRQ